MIRTIEKWYELLDFPLEWKDEVFESAREFTKETVEYIEQHEEPYSWLFEQENKMLCLLYALYKCESFFIKAKTRDIPDDILFMTLTEVKRYAKEYKDTVGKLGIRQIKWLGKILNGNIYRLGRLEFEMRDAMHSAESLGLCKGDNVLGVHIPDNGGAFDESACNEAYRLAEEFFAKYFPEYEYKCYVCHSWLLDRTLKNFLKPTSNIVKFMESYEEIENEEAYTALTFLFGRGTTIEDLKSTTPTTSLQKGIIEHLQSGGKLYSTFGVKARLQLN